MYFPFLTNKRAENIALRNLSDSNKLANVIPIIDTEFYDTNTDWTDPNSINEFIEKKFKDLIRTFSDNNNQFIVPVNISLLNNVTVELLLQKFVEFSNEDIVNNCIFGIYDITVLNNEFFNDKNYAFFHNTNIINENTNAIYNILLNESLLFDFINSTLENKVIISDSFISRDINRNYTNDDTFNNCIFSYVNSGFAGCGDYTIVPKNTNSAGGGNMNNITVATHLTYKQENQLFVKHHICTPEEEPDNRLRVSNVLNQIRNEPHNFFQSDGINQLINLEGTSLEMLKRLTIAHHIEKMNSLIEN